MAQTHVITKGLLFVLFLIAVIVVIILHSYKIWGKGTDCTGLQAQCNATDVTPILRPPGVGLEFSVSGMNNEGFLSDTLTVSNQTSINNNKTYLNDILRLMKQQYPKVDTTLSNYGLFDPNINTNSPLKIDSTNLDAEYQVKFIQELQNKEITNLESWLAQLKAHAPEKQIVYDSNTVKSVKHIPTGKLFGVLKNPNQVGQQISIIIDPKNATCIKYITPSMYANVSSANKDEPIKNIDLTACDYNPRAPGQKFMLETVTSNSEFNDMLNTNERAKYSVSADYGFGVYPFSVIKTAGPAGGAFDTHVASAECITLDNSGLSIEPCTGKESQRFTMTDIPVDLGI